MQNSTYDESLSISNIMSNKGLDPTSKNVWLLVTFRTPRLAFTDGVHNDLNVIKSIPSKPQNHLHIYEIEHFSYLLGFSLV